MNNWDDVNSYFTMGKGMMNGLVPYRDLFDQKGILLYFLYGLAYLLSHTTHIGVFLLEWIAAALHLLAVQQLAFRLCRAEENGSRAMLVRILLPLYAACVYSTRCMWYGGSAEELMLPLFAWGLVLAIDVLHREKSVWKDYLAAGLLAGCVFHIKFNSLGFFFGWMAAVLLLRLREDRVKKTLLHIVSFFAGVLAITLPFLLYFLINHAVKDWFRVTIWLNLTVYSEKLPFGERVYEMMKTLYYHYLDNPGAFVPASLGVLWFLLSRKFSIGEKLAVFSTALFLGLGIFIGGVTLPYYPLPLTVYAAFFIPAAVTVIDKLPKVKAGSVAFCVLLFCVVLGGSAAVIRQYSLNPKFMKMKEEDMFQYRFRDVIRQSGIENPTLLNMRCFDVGLYTVADIVPTCYFFQTQTIHLDDVYEMQRENIRRADTDFVVAESYPPDGIFENYEEIDHATWDYFGTEIDYYLYQRKDER